MVIDKILDRKDSGKYNAKTFYNDVMQYGKIGHGITNAMDNGLHHDIQYEIIKYLVDNDYDNIDGILCKYVRDNEWL